MNYWLEMRSKRERARKSDKSGIDRRRSNDVPLWKIASKSSKKLPGKSPK